MDLDGLLGEVLDSVVNIDTGRKDFSYVEMQRKALFAQ
jgi:hypothetical protein